MKAKKKKIDTIDANDLGVDLTVSIQALTSPFQVKYSIS